MKNQNGITMSGLVVYIVVTFIVIAILTTLTVNYRSTIKNMDDDSKYASDYSKFNLYFLEETTKKGNNIKAIEDSRIKFESGVEFNYKEGKIFLNEDIKNKEEGAPTKKTIKLIENVKKCKFQKKEENDKTIIVVTMQIGNAEERTMKYTLNIEEDTVTTDEDDYISGITKIPTGWDSTKLNENDPFRTEKINVYYNIAPIPKGYEVSTEEGENKISKGLIITDGTNRFKWYLKEELIEYNKENYGTTWTAAIDTTDLADATAIYNSFESSKDLYGGAYIEETTEEETIKSILWIK